MKYFGIGLIIVGAIWGIIAFNMKTTVETESRSFGEGIYSIRVPSQTVHNLDLADKRRNHLIGAGITLLAGVLFFGFGTLQRKEIAKNVTTSSDVKCPFCAETIKKEALVCRYCGKDTPNKNYNEITELMKKHGISKKFDKYYYDTHDFDTLDEAVNHAKFVNS